ncbi:MAG: UDP-N-acetylmuramate dehydrogenase [Deltaproteobacteria bacterium]|nr:UDP-N-acetylmuramate dehydrogenase [Deltaproteobacteria bacterium]
MDKDEVKRTLRKLLPAGKVVFDESLDRYTSMGVGGRTDIMIFPENTEEVIKTVAYLREREIPFLPVGNWTNLIVMDSGYRGAVISLKGLRNIEMSEKSRGAVSLRAEAGASLSELVALSLREALTGMEFCTGIPGSVGGAVRMNAGAHGREIKDVLETIRLITRGGEPLEMKRESLTFAYRSLDLPEDSIITGASFLLKKGEKTAVEEQVAGILQARREKHPLEYRNAGSIFKNPPGIPAGRIIEELGLKGVRIGDAQISEKHANFIVNLGHAKAVDIVALIDLVIKKVKGERGIDLEPEVRIIGTGE